MARLAPERKAALDGGTQATSDLAECLAIDQTALAQSVLPGLELEAALPHILAMHREVSSKGISHQIAAIGMAIRWCCLRCQAQASGVLTGDSPLTCVSN